MAATFAVLLVGSAVLGPGASAAEPAPPQAAARTEIPASAFAGQNQFSGPIISPDGKLLAVRRTVAGRPRILLVDPVTQVVRHEITLGDEQELRWYRWFGKERILLSVSERARIAGEERGFSRMFSFDFTTGTLSLVGHRGEGTIGDDLLYADPAGQFLLLSLQRTIYDWPSVWRFETVAGQPMVGREVQPQRRGIWGWYADNAGNVRMGLSTEFERLKFWYRAKPGDDLKVVAKVDEKDRDNKVWEIVEIYADSDEGYILEKVDDRVSLRKFNFATREAGEVIYRNPDWDVTGVMLNSKDLPEAVYYSDDKQHVVWLDQKLATVQARLEKAMPNLDVRISSRASDDSRMVVEVGRENDPGAFYVYTPTEKSLKFLANYRPELITQQLAQPNSVEYTARDGTKIHAYLTLPAGQPGKALPLVILPHGGPYGVRDTMAYSDEVQFIASRGYAVLQPNYRGSGGYGEAFVNLGKGQIGRLMQDDLDDAMDWAVKQGFADPGRVCVVGSSYGGFAALWAVIRNPERYRCAASFAGVTDWERQLRYDTRFLSMYRRGERQAWTEGEANNFDFSSVSPVKQVRRLKRPVLLAHGMKDSRVPFTQFNDLKNSAKEAGIPIETLSFPEAGHGFSRPEDEQRWYETLGAFLQRHNPAQ
jgi:dipeptidyl aminopeptidase/acylaminoacyl peptidase